MGDSKGQDAHCLERGGNVASPILLDGTFQDCPALFFLEFLQGLRRDLHAREDPLIIDPPLLTIQPRCQRMHFSWQSGCEWPWAWHQLEMPKDSGIPAQSCHPLTCLRRICIPGLSALSDTLARIRCTDVIG